MLSRLRPPAEGGFVIGRNRELIAHVALALARYEKEAKLDGLPVPPELAGICEFLMDCATTRHCATGLGADGVASDAEAMTNHPVLTKREAAAALRISVRTLERLIASGALSTIRVADSTRVRRIDLEKYIEEMARPTKFRDSIAAKDMA